MDIASLLLSILGLCVFEIVSSIDNAVVNADILATMSKKWRRWFLIYGIFFSVFLVRGLLPWFIVWLSNPSMGFMGALTATFSSNAEVEKALELSAPLLLVGGGVFLVLLFLHWLFLEHKEFGLPIERFFSRQGVWFYAFASAFLLFIIWESLRHDPRMAFAASIGSTAFFLTHGFKEQAVQIEMQMKQQHEMSDISKLIYLEILDATFSIDGVIGAFAFTMSIPIILIGNGLGALVVRELTIRGVDHIKKYVYLKNGAMYSIVFLGMIMILESFHIEVPHYVAPLITFVIIGWFFTLSHRMLKKKPAA